MFNNSEELIPEELRKKISLTSHQAQTVLDFEIEFINQTAKELTRCVRLFFLGRLLFAILGIAVLLLATMSLAYYLAETFGSMPTWEIFIITAAGMGVFCAIFYIASEFSAKEMNHLLDEFMKHWKTNKEDNYAAH